MKFPKNALSGLFAALLLITVGGCGQGNKSPDAGAPTEDIEMGTASGSPGPPAKEPAGSAPAASEGAAPADSAPAEGKPSEPAPAESK